MTCRYGPGATARVVLRVDEYTILYLLSGTFVEQPLLTGCPLPAQARRPGKAMIAESGNVAYRPSRRCSGAILPARLANCQGGSASIGREAPAADEGQQVRARLGDFSANICIPLTCLRSKWREQ